MKCTGVRPRIQGSGAAIRSLPPRRGTHRLLPLSSEVPSTLAEEDPPLDKATSSFVLGHSGNGEAEEQGLCDKENRGNERSELSWAPRNLTWMGLPRK